MCKDLGNNTYECSGTCGANGSVWGTGLYTADSNVYAAAKHMGITPGRFLKTMLPGFSAYLGVALNGVTTLSYHNYGSSFILSKIQFGGINFDNVKNELKNLIQQEVQRVINNCQAEKYEIKAHVTQEITKVNNHSTQKTTIIENAIKQQYSKIALNEEVATNGIKMKIAEQVSKLKSNEDVMKIEMKSVIKDIIQQAIIHLAEEKGNKMMKQVFIAQFQKYNNSILNTLKKDKLLCVTCGQNQRSRMVFPCAHFHYCQICIKKVRQVGKCPSCQAEYTGDLKVNQ